MSNDHWQLIKEIFDEAADIPQAGWAQYLDGRCKGDSDLRREVEELLKMGAETELTLDRLKVPRLPSPSGLPALAPRFLVGDLVGGHYRVTRFIAAGGMGEVYAATHTETGACVALKCIRNHVLFTGQYAVRFQREAMLSSRIDHPNVCRVHEVLDDENGSGELFIAMDLIEGETLEARLAGPGGMSHQEVLTIAKQLCDGVEAAHRAGVLHRDLKPGNILMIGDRPVIIDFGLARGVAGDASLTSAGAVIGTLAYVAPEQLEHGSSSPASDVYSLGVVLYEMLLGEKPHVGKSPFRLAAEKAREAHRSPELAVPGLPRVWLEVLERCLKAKPEERLQSAGELKALLERGRPTAAFEATRLGKRAFWPIAAATALMAAALVGYFIERDYMPSEEVTNLFRQGERAMADGAPTRTIQLMKRAIESDPRYLMTRSQLAIAYTEIEQFDEARDAVLEAKDVAGRLVFPGRGQEWTLDVASALVVRDFKTAAERAGKLARFAPKAQRGYALQLHARIVEQLGRNDEAQELLAKAILEDPANWSAHVHHATHVSRQDKGQALAEFAAVEKVFRETANDEGLSDLLLARTESSVESRHDEQRDLEEVLQLSGRTGNRYQSLMAKIRVAGVYTARGEFDRAAGISRESATQANRGNMPVVEGRALAAYGRTFADRRRWSEAEPILQDALKIGERSRSQLLLAGVRMTLGEVLEALERNDEAAATMEPAIAFYRQARNPDIFPVLLVKWGRLLNSVGRVQEGTQALREASDLTARRKD